MEQITDRLVIFDSSDSIVEEVELCRRQKFIKEWNETAERLLKSGVDLSKIPITKRA